MISYRTKVKLARVLQLVGQCEWELEQMRQDLCQNEAYELYTVFKRLDRQRKGHIDLQDLRIFLQDNNFLKEAEQADWVLLDMDKNKDEMLSYSEFSAFMQCKQNERLRNLVNHRQPYAVQQNQKLDFDLEFALAKVFQQLIRHSMELRREQEQLAGQFDWNIQEAFEHIDQQNKGFLDVAALDRFFKEMDCYVSDQQFDSLFWRIDSKRNGVISFEEFSGSVSCAYLQHNYQSLPSRPPSRVTNNNNYSSQRAQNITQQPRPQSPISTMPPQNLSMHRPQSPLARIHETQHLNDQYKSYQMKRSVNKPPAPPSYDRSRVSPAQPQRLLSPQLPNQSSYRNTATSRFYSPSRDRVAPQRNPLGRAVSPSQQRVVSPSHQRVVSPSQHRMPSPSRMPTNGLYSSINMSQSNPRLPPSQYRVSSPPRAQPNLQYSRSPAHVPQDEYFLTNMFQQQIQLDKQLEHHRQQITLKNDFNLLDGFRQLDTQAKGFLTKLDLQNSLLELGANFGSSQLSLFFKKYDKDNDGLLKYSDFCRMVTPHSHHYSAVLKQKEPYYDNTKMMSWESRAALKDLLQASLDAESKAEQLRQSLQNRPAFNCTEAFDALDRQNKGFLTPDEFRQMLEQHGVFVNSHDLHTLLNRYDTNQDGKVSYSEFYQEMRPRSPRKL